MSVIPEKFPRKEKAVELASSILEGFSTSVKQIVSLYGNAEKAVNEYILPEITYETGIEVCLPGCVIKIPDNYRGERRNLANLLGGRDWKETLMTAYATSRFLNCPIRVGDYLKIPLHVESAEHDGVEYDKIDIDSTDLTVVCVSLGRIVFNFEDVVFFGPMNKRNTNEGGFKNSAMAHYLNDEFLAAFGDIADIMGKTVDGVKITLPTKYEVFGKGVKESNWSDPPQQFEYYRKYKNRIKVQDDDTKWWWLSTPYSASAAYFCHVDHDGHAYYATASSSGGAAPAFCLS